MPCLSSVISKGSFFALIMRFMSDPQNACRQRPHMDKRSLSYHTVYDFHLIALQMCPPKATGFQS